MLLWFACDPNRIFLIFSPGLHSLGALTASAAAQPRPQGRGCSQSLQALWEC